jgi:RNA polymerase sigma-70 factor, ECF subfamily
MNLNITDSGHQIKELFDKHFHHLVLHAFRHVRDYSQSEEIVQDVFVKIWRNFDQIGHVSDFKPYLYKAVHNSSLNYLRHIKIRQKYNVETAHLNDNTENQTEDSILDEENYNRIHQAVNKLPQHWKEAIILSKYDKLKYHEIAERMKISQKTVEKYISKALQLLRVELKDLLITLVLILKFFPKV